MYAIAIMAKAPFPDKVKTGLLPPLAIPKRWLRKQKKSIFLVDRVKTASSFTYRIQIIINTLTII